MRYLVITNCRDCIEWCPADSHGIGTRCGATLPEYRIVDEVRHPDGDYAAPIPDWCPRLATHTGPECPADCERHMGYARYCDVSLSGCIRNAEDYYKPKG